MDPNTTSEQEYEIHGGFNQDSISTKYDELSKNYDEVYSSVGWPDPGKCAEGCINNGYTKDSYILDMACGTGKVCDELMEQARVESPHIIGIDASEGMLERAKNNSNYETLHKSLLCNPEEFKVNFPEYLEKFDFVTASGLLAEGHATNDIFDEMIMCLKKGGYAVFTSRVEYMTSMNYQEGIERSYWKLISKDVHEKYSNAREK